MPEPSAASDASAPREATVEPRVAVHADVRRLLESYGLSHTGRVRAANEDHFVTATLQRSVQLRQTNLDDTQLFDKLAGPRAYLYAVADGVGGASGGKVASALAVAGLVEYLAEAVGAYNGFAVDHDADFPGHLTKAVHRAHDHLADTFRLRGQGGPATTLTVAMVVWPRAYLVHVGDSRAYLLRDARLARLTRDQTLGEFLVTQHGMPREQAEQAGLYNVLASAVGAQDMIPVVDSVPLRRGDRVLLCTDGLTKHVSDEQIGEVLGQSSDSEAACRRLIELALAGGGSDNVTAVVVRVLGG